ncbi:MAG TPA: LLM class flavin-dependent oxidoreductase [Chloroflexota bacterium]|nr:LLM class flavin-dependent oxidoreductase [Chloroflexota bacterium]
MRISPPKFDYYILNTYQPEADGAPERLYASWLEQALAAEDLGYDTLWCTEHHFRHFGGMMPNPQLFLASVASRTRRIRLGTAVAILPLHHPMRIAEDVAMLDNISGGRVEVGVGRGMPQAEYEIFGADWETSHEHVTEALAIMRKSWAGQLFRWQGEHYRYGREVTVFPPPVQKPHPPVWVTANFDESHFRWIGRQGFNLMTLPWALPSYDRSRELIGIYQDSLADAGHDPARRNVLAMFPTHVCETAAEARAAEGYWARMVATATGERGGDLAHAMSFDDIVAQSRGIYGDVARCREHVAYIRDKLGLTHIATMHHFGGVPQETVLRSMRLFAEGVASAFSSG